MALACPSSASPFRRMANSSPPSRARASPGRRHDSRRRDAGDQQLVADQVAEAVVDDLESIEVEIQHRERIADAPDLDLVEPAPEPFHEDRAVEESRQRIEEPDAAEPLLRNRLFRRVGERSGDAVGATVRALSTARPRQRNRR